MNTPFDTALEETLGSKNVSSLARHLHFRERINNGDMVMPKVPLQVIQLIQLGGLWFS